MKRDFLSGFDDIQGSDMLKAKIASRVKSGDMPHESRYRQPMKWAVPVACVLLAAVITVPAIIYFRSGFPPATTTSKVGSRPGNGVAQAGVSRSGENSTGIADTASLQAKGITLLQAPPAGLQSETSNADWVGIPEADLYKKAAVIAYGEVVGFQWVKLKDAPAPYEHLSFETIVTLKIVTPYRGSFQSGDTIDVLLPFPITGEGHGVFLDAENANKLEKGTRAIFFIYSFSDTDLVGEASWNIHGKDICAYGTSGGDESILLEENGTFRYGYAPHQMLSLSEIGDLIRTKLKVS